MILSSLAILSCCGKRSTGCGSNLSTDTGALGCRTLSSWLLSFWKLDFGQVWFSQDCPILHLFVGPSAWEGGWRCFCSLCAGGENSASQSPLSFLSLLLWLLKLLLFVSPTMSFPCSFFCHPGVVVPVDCGLALASGRRSSGVLSGLAEILPSWVGPLSYTKVSTVILCFFFMKQ